MGLKITTDAIIFPMMNIGQEYIIPDGEELPAFFMEDIIGTVFCMKDYSKENAEISGISRLIRSDSLLNEYNNRFMLIPSLNFKRYDKDNSKKVIYQFEFKIENENT